MIISIVTPEKSIVFKKEGDEITVPAFKGELNILDGHTPLITTLEPGVIKYKVKGGGFEKLAISWGYCQVFDNSVNVLVEMAVTPQEVNVKSADSRISELEKKLMTELSEIDLKQTVRELGRARAEKQLVQ